MFRVGFGQDSHRFSNDVNRKLVLGGVLIPGVRGLDGNSDADVVLHALCRALEQAVGNQDFSRYADEMSRTGINDSREYVKVAKAHVEGAGYRVNNIGLSIEAREPKVDSFCEAMKNAVAEILDIAPGAVGVNATSGEQMTPFGKGEGIQVFAIVSVVADTGSLG
jgi:2-C-methyl-D-erythritol 2,4-cyclodiphosphate synthase